MNEERWIVGCVNEANEECQKALDYFKSRNKTTFTKNISYEKEEKYMKQLGEGREMLNHPFIWRNSIFIGRLNDAKRIIEGEHGKSFLFPKRKGMNHKSITEYSGYIPQIVAGLSYIMERHKSDCIINETFESTLGIYYYEESKTVRTYTSIWKSIRECKGKRFYIIPLTLVMQPINHSNILVYDSHEKSMERFEPYGGVPDDKADIVDELIIDLFAKNMPNFIEIYYKPIDYCPKLSFQSFQEMENEMEDYDPEGYCSVWVLWYIDLRLSNSEISRENIIKHSIKTLFNLDHSFTTFIRDYSVSLRKYYDLILYEGLENIYNKGKDEFEYSLHNV